MTNNKYEDFYKNIKEIGSGPFSTVYKAKAKDKEEFVAIKVTNKERIKTALRNDYSKQDIRQEYYQITNLENEVKYMKICGENNENSVEYYKHFETENEFVIVMELCDGNLIDLIKLKKEFTLNDIYELLCQLNNTFKIMKEKRIAHRDLKLTNILFKFENEEKTKCTFKITDYGVSKEFLRLSNRFSSKVGTVNFMAPEVLSEEKYNYECDLWSLGVIIYMLYFKNYPYMGANEFALINQIKNLGKKILKSSGDKNFDDLIRGLLTSIPSERLTWEQYFNHPFFRNKPFSQQKQKIKNEIKIILRIRNIDIKRGKNIYFLESDLFRNIGEPEHQNINNLNDTNTEIYIDNKKTNFTKYIPSTNPAKDYEIRIVFKSEMIDCSYMFRGCTNIDMSYMFNKCLSLEKIEFPPSFITKNVKNMEFMFHMCSNLKKIDFPKSFITNNVTDMSVMFGKCHNLESLDLQNFVTENVKNMKYMFDQCHNLKEILINPQNFNTSKVINMGHMFNECETLEFIDLSHFNTDNVQYFTFMFKGCKKLNNLDTLRFNTNSNANIGHMFDSDNSEISFITNENDDRASNMFDNKNFSTDASSSRFSNI